MGRFIGWISLIAGGAIIIAVGRGWLSRVGNAVGLGTKTYGPISRWLYRHDPWHEGAYAMALERLGLTADDTYLDVACGSGALVALALETVDRAAGLDHSPAAIEVAVELNSAAVAAGRAEFVQADAGDLPWDDASFDAVSNLNTLHIIAEPRPILREVHRVLKPGGRFVLVTQSPASLEGALWAPVRQMLSLHSDAQVAALLGEIGFSKVEVSSPDGERQLGYGVKPAEPLETDS
jgi:SAM-dependent methyltransferase